MSGILGAYQDSTDQALDVMGSRPLEAETPKPKHSGWTTIPRAVGAAAAEIGGNLADIAGAYGQTAAIQYAGNPLVGEKAQQQARDAYDRLTTEGIDWRSPASKPAYEFSRDMRPDPLTAGKAEEIVFGLTKGLTKAIGAGVLLGPAGGAVTFGVSEGMVASEDLAEQGVDKSTRAKVGTVTGALTAAMVGVPVVGKNLAQTGGLVLVGGPAAFMAQQQASRTILENADYAEIAMQFDPLDPVGLTVSTLVPAGFAGWAMRGSMRAKPVTGETPGAVIETAQPKPTPEQIDAVMVQNLTAAGDAREVIDPAFIKAIDEAVPPEVAPEPAPAPAPIEAVPPIDAPAKADTPQDQAAPTEAVKTEAPDIPVEVTEDGAHISAAKKLEDARRLAQEGTDTELGALDAPLLKVAAECFLSQ